MADPAPRKATYADIEALPPHVVGEILFGTLVTHPRPVPRHGAAQVNLSLELADPYQRGNGGPGGWVFATEPELHLGGHVVVPDIAGWRRERFLIDPDKVGIPVAPDWVCEILSPSTESYDRNQKRRIYASAGIGYFWLLEPRLLQLECFQLVAGNWLLANMFQRGERVSAPPFEAISFPLNALFPFDAEKSPE